VGGGDACLNDAAQDCSPAEPAHPGAQLDVGTVTATVVDQNGDPAADMVADICGTNICAVYGHTDAAGLFDENAMATPIDDPLLLYGDGITFSKMGIIIDQLGADALGTVSVIRLPPVAQGADFCAGAEATSNDVSISVPARASIHIDKLLYTDPAQYGFRAAVVDAADMVHADLDPNLEVLVGTAPIDTLICPGATMTFPNPKGWADGTVVHVYLYGSKIFDHEVPYGTWGQISTATVTPDGIVTDAGQEIGILGVFGLDPQL